VDLVMSGDLDLEAMVSARRPLAEAAEALADLPSGRVLRQLLLCGPAPGRELGGGRSGR
jgi:S-(hydroxymethyl)glutathione dehydrogenase / alcohol dehydrogenase